MITRAKYELMKIFVSTGIKTIVLVFIFLSLFLSEASSRETVYVFPPNYIGELEGKLALAEEALREEINLYFDLAHNPSYEKSVVDFMKGNSDGILNQFFYGECKEDCLLSQRILLERLYMKSLYSLTISDSENLTKVVLLRVSREKADSETEYCESCTDEDLKVSVKSLVRQLEGPLEIAKEEPKLDLPPENEEPDDQTLDHRKRIENSDAIVLIAPIWNFRMPAIVEGWIDKVLAPPWAFRFKKLFGNYGYPLGNLKGKKAVVFCTYGSPQFAVRTFFLNMPTKRLRRGVFNICGITDVVYRRYFAVPFVEDKKRKKFLEDVKKTANNI
mgnify:CR=1 FL=1